MFYPIGSRPHRPFPFRAKEMHAEGFSKRLHSNMLLVPSLAKKHLVKAGENANNPKQLIDVHQQHPLTWHQISCVFTEEEDFPLIMVVGTGAGVIMHFVFYFVLILFETCTNFLFRISMLAHFVRLSICLVLRQMLMLMRLARLILSIPWFATV